MMETIWLVFKDVWFYYVLYVICFILSVEYMINFFDDEIKEKKERIDGLIEDYNKVIDKHNKLVDAHNELGNRYNNLLDYYETAYSKYYHTLSVDQNLNGKSIATFVQIFYHNSKEMMCISTRFHMSGKISSIRFGEDDYENDTL